MCVCVCVCMCVCVNEPTPRGAAELVMNTDNSGIECTQRHVKRHIKVAFTRPSAVTSSATS